MSFQQSLATFLAAQLIFALAPASAQVPAPVSPAQSAPLDGVRATLPAPEASLSAPMVDGLKVLVLEGQRSVNDISRHIGVEPVVEVRDDNDRPVDGATVIFRLPPSGPGGAFGGKSLTKSVKTNVQGQAGAAGFVPNDQPGRFEIRVTALLGNRMGQAVISETNSQNSLVMVAPKEKKHPLWRNKYVLIGVAAAVAAGVALAITHGSSQPNVTVTPGTVIINQ